MSRVSPLLSRYLAKQFLVGFVACMAVLAGIIILFETVELLRRAEGHDNISMLTLLEMAFLKTPETVQIIMPFGILFSALYTLWRLSRSQELIVARAVGVSVWQYLLPLLLVGFALGVTRVAVINPIGAAMITRYEQLDSRLLRGKAGTINISKGGLWLRQSGDADASIVIHAEGIEPSGDVFRMVTVFFIKPDGSFASRYDAKTAKLHGGNWRLDDVWINRPNMPTNHVDEISLQTDLTIGQIEESLAAPETLSFWSLPQFIRTLHLTGFSARRHELYFQSLLATPFLFSAMVLFAAAFSIRSTRRGGNFVLIAGGVATGLGIYVLNDVIGAMGTSEILPVFVSAWFPSVIALIAATIILLHVEDG